MRRSGQDGYALLVILLALSLLVIALAAAVPSWKTEIQREREARMIDHAREYRTAIQRYYHQNGRYPASMDALLQKDGNGIRYLRQDWPDPLSLKDGGKWQVLHYGQVVTAEIVDQAPAAATAAAGLGTIPGLGSGNSPAGGRPSSPGAAAMASAPAGGSAINSGIADSNSNGSSTGAGSGPVIGLASTNKQPAVHSFNGFDTPDHWQFVYNFAQDPSLRARGAVTPRSGQGSAGSRGRGGRGGGRR